MSIEDPRGGLQRNEVLAAEVGMNQMNMEYNHTRQA